MPSARRPLVFAASMLSAVLLAGCAAASGSPSTSPSPSTPPPIAEPSSSPSTTPTGEIPDAEATCDTIITDAFTADLATDGWTGWSLPRDGIGHDPFDVFPGGAPAGSISCRFGRDPDLATDNVLDLAWSPAVDDTESVQRALEAEGYVRLLEDADGVRFAYPTPPEFQGDEDGYGVVYLFGADDIRWAPLSEYLDFIQDPRG